MSRDKNLQIEEIQLAKQLAFIHLCFPATSGINSHGSAEVTPRLDMIAATREV